LVFYPNGYYNGNKTYICTGIQNLDIENDNSIEVLAKFIIVLYNYNDNSLIYSKGLLLIYLCNLSIYLLFLLNKFFN